MVRVAIAIDAKYDAIRLAGVTGPSRTGISGYNTAISLFFS